MAASGLTTRGRRRSRRSRRRVPAGLDEPAALPWDGPRCCTCSRPLSRVPTYLASWQGASSGFQCERCFYHGTGRSPGRATTVSSERNRWLVDLVDGTGPAASTQDKGADDE